MITTKVPILQLSLCILDLIFFEVRKIEDSTPCCVIKIMFYNCCFLSVMANVNCQLDMSGKREPQLKNYLHQMAIWTCLGEIFSNPN